jgi:hypothetical protein
MWHGIDCCAAYIPPQPAHNTVLWTQRLCVDAQHQSLILAIRSAAHKRAEAIGGLLTSLVVEKKCCRAKEGGSSSLQSAKCHNFPYIFLLDGHVAFSTPWRLLRPRRWSPRENSQQFQGKLPP